jgi:protein-tyrosine phosphatase
MKPGVLFVCLGNICRSPTAHGVFRNLLLKHGLQNKVRVDSAGTGNWHVGRPPDKRAIDAAVSQGYDISDLRARRVDIEDFQKFDYLLAMDWSNLNHLQTLCPEKLNPHIGLFLDYLGKGDGHEVPDPYYGGISGFADVLDMVEKASMGLLKSMRERYPDLRED